MKATQIIKKSIGIKLLTLFIMFLQGCASSPTELPEKTKSDSSSEAVKKLGEDPTKAVLAGNTFFYPFLFLKLTLPEQWDVRLSDKSLQPISAGNGTIILDAKKDAKGFTVLDLENRSDGTSKQSMTIYLTELSKSPSFVSELNTISDKEVIKFFNIGLRQSLEKDGYSFEEPYYSRLGDVEYNVFPTIPSIPDSFIEADISATQDYYTVFIRDKHALLTFINTSVGKPKDLKDSQLKKIIEKATFLSAKTKTN